MDVSKPSVSNLCRYLSFLFVAYCVNESNENARLQRKRGVERFEVIYDWNYVNFTWLNADDYNLAIINGKYIPANNVISNVKFYRDKMYVALPRLFKGTPVTLAVMTNSGKYENNKLLKPYPSWKMNSLDHCAALQNVYSMEIDKYGVMWVLDGVRITNGTKCPPKLVLLDLKRQGNVVRYFDFPEHLSSVYGGFLTDLVIDEADGGFAYITESSDHDPGIIVYSKHLDKAWKIRDRSMFAEITASNFVVEGNQNSKLQNINGIALSPVPKNPNQERLIYYTPLIGVNMFAISNKLLKNQVLMRGDVWRRGIKYIGKREGVSDRMMIDNEGNMYYGILNLYGICKWNIFEPFITSKMIIHDQMEYIWPASFGMDNSGNLYVLSNSLNKFLQSKPPKSSDKSIIKVSRLYTGTRSYLYKNSR
ncbi:protein yellow-like [Onthophagus taurus]|uniref:protein yellow-like n=1 Tax=Onthophagus taurus TaxID=166361 RepID=UPI0039BDEBAA